MFHEIIKTPKWRCERTQAVVYVGPKKNSLYEMREEEIRKKSEEGQFFQICVAWIQLVLCIIYAVNVCKSAGSGLNSGAGFGCIVFLCREKEELNRNTFPHSLQWCVPAEPVWICECSCKKTCQPIRRCSMGPNAIIEISFLLPSAWFCLGTLCHIQNIYSDLSIQVYVSPCVWRAHVDWAKLRMKIMDQ